MVELVELSRDHEEEKSDQKNDRQTGLCVRRANIAIPYRAAQDRNPEICENNIARNGQIQTKRKSECVCVCCRGTGSRTKKLMLL